MMCTMLLVWLAACGTPEECEVGDEFLGPIHRANIGLKSIVASGDLDGLRVACGVDDNQNVRCWGRASPPHGLGNIQVTEVAISGGFAVCGLTDDGTVRCANSDGAVASPLPEGTYRHLRSDWHRLCGLDGTGVVCDDGTRLPGTYDDFSLTSGMEICAIFAGSVTCGTQTDSETMAGPFLRLEADCGWSPDHVKCVSGILPCEDFTVAAFLNRWKCFSTVDGQVECADFSASTLNPRWLPTLAVEISAIAGTSDIGVCGLTDSEVLCWDPSRRAAVDNELAALDGLK